MIALLRIFFLTFLFVYNIDILFGQKELTASEIISYFNQLESDEVIENDSRGLVINC